MLYYVCLALSVSVGLLIADKIVNGLIRFDRRVVARRKKAAAIGERLSPLVAVSDSPVIKKAKRFLTDYTTGDYKDVLVDLDTFIKDLLEKPEDVLAGEVVAACRQIVKFADQKAAMKPAQAA
jgi:hypothetical protein